jgi:hypothetical protein
MDKRFLGWLLCVAGLAGMVLAVYLFMTGSGGKGHLFEVSGYLIAGAIAFFSGVHYAYTKKTAVVRENGGTIPSIPATPRIETMLRPSALREVTVAEKK